MKREDILDLAVSNGFYRNDEGTITSPFIEDVDISELLLDFAEDVAARKQDQICRQIAVLHDSITLASHSKLRAGSKK